MDQLFLLHEFARYACWHAGFARWYDDPHARVTAATHGTATSIDHEAHQETAQKQTTFYSEQTTISLEINTAW